MFPQVRLAAGREHPPKRAPPLAIWNQVAPAREGQGIGYLKPVTASF